MAEIKCPDEISGTQLTVKHCIGAWESFIEALESIPVAKRERVKIQLDLLVKRLSNGERLSVENFPQEGNLPSLNGKPAKRFYSFKKIPVRAYGWYSETIAGTFFISHYIFKNSQKLSVSDTNKVQRNWTRIEEEGHEK